MLPARCRPWPRRRRRPRRRAAPRGRRDKRPRAYDDDDDEEEDAGSKKPKRVEGAATPGEIERALTFKGATIAWAILKRKKVLENRPYRLPCGGWIAIHVGKGAFEGDYRGLVTDCRLPTEEELMRAVAGGAETGRGVPFPLVSADFRTSDRPSERWQATIVGAFRVKECRRPQNCGGSFWAQGPVCNVVDAVIELKEPVSAPKGKLSLWLMDDDARDAVAAGLKDAPVLTNDLGALPPYEPILGPITPGRNKRREMGNVEHVFPRGGGFFEERLGGGRYGGGGYPGAYAAYHDALPPPYYAPRAYSPPFPPHAPPYGGAPGGAPPPATRATAPRRAPARRRRPGHPPPFDAPPPGAYDPTARRGTPGPATTRAAPSTAAPTGGYVRGPLEASREWLYRSHYPPHHDRGDDARRDAPPLYDAPRGPPPPYPHPPRYDPGPPPP
ncbi:hypothetical protein JL720_15864 [Aureococcus anophagefferens]|nr:hypothetical protein JL720_15864 [Aureococcus anophagefferens]